MKIGIIGGSGLDDPNLIEKYEEKEVETKYGKPSSKIVCGKIEGVDICILARHGKKHEIPPSQINYRANIAALKMLGVTHIIASSAVGSLREGIKPGDLIFPDQFIDFTKSRKNTFYDEIGEGKVQHISMAEPFSNLIRESLINTAKNLGFKIHERATIAVIEGPRFSSRSESYFFKNFADIIGMTAFPEVALAKEAEIEYASIAMATDYDCWKKDEEPVTWEMIKKRMKENSDKVKNLILEVIPRLANQQVSEQEKEYIKGKIRTIPNFPKPGIMFRDITTLLKDKEGMKKVMEILERRYKNTGIEIVAGIESRGFIIGGILADRLGAEFVPIRKPGKLPAETIKQEYELEYGKDAIEIHKDAIKPGQRVLVVDDLIATGGSASAACSLIEKLGGKIEEIAFVIELADLKGREKLSIWKVFSIVEFKGE